jgi:hypothetical protein
MFTLFIELLLLGVTDNIIRRSNTMAHIANYCLIKPKCFERLNLHIRVLCSTSALIRLLRLPEINRKRIILKKSQAVKYEQDILKM